MIATEQPFDEIASSLEQNGFSRDGDVLTSADDPVDAAATAVAGGDGVIALGFDAATVEAAAGEEPEAPKGAERDLIADLEGPAAIVLAVPEDSTACFTAIGFVDRLANGEGEFVVVAEEPSADAFVLDDGGDDPLTEGFEFGAATAEEDRVVAPVTYPIEELGGPGGLLFGDVPSSAIYECEGEG